MTHDDSPLDPARIERVLEMVLDLAAGKLDTRLEPSQRRDTIDNLITGLNMLAEELQAAIAAERRTAVELEAMVRARTAELADKLETIARQNETIQELSTPVLQVWEGILVLPLIGVIDTGRAHQITEQLLQSLARSHASVAIIDLTGVPMVDTAVIRHLLSTVQAARLLGAEVIITGLSPLHAQVIVRLGVRLENVITKGSLQEGLQRALRLTAGRGA